jgi:hypothetical protein
MPELEGSEKELKQDGYHQADPRTASKTADAIRSGRAPDAKDLRTTKANHEGRAAVEKRLLDPNLTPEDKQKLQNDLAGRVQNGPAPTGNLHRDLHQVNKSVAPAGGATAAAPAQDGAAGGHEGSAPVTAGHEGAAPTAAKDVKKPDEAKDATHQLPSPLDHMAQFVFNIEGSGAIQKALVFVSAGPLTLAPDVFFFFHGQWANYGIDPDQYAALVARDEKKDPKHDKAWHDKKYLESGRKAITEAMERAQGHNLISIVPQGVMGGGGSNGGQMNTLHKKGSLSEVIASVMKQLQAKLKGDLMQPGRIAISGHSAGGYEGVQQALAASGSMKDTITDVTLMDQEYGGGGQYQQVLGWMLHGKPGKSLRVVAESTQLRVGQFDAKTHQAKGLWDRFIGPDALPAKAHAAGFTVVDKGGAGHKQGASKTVIYHAQVMKGSEVQCDVLVMQSSLGHHPLRDDVMDDAALNIGQGAAGNTSFGTANHGVMSAEVAPPQALPASVPKPTVDAHKQDHVPEPAAEPAHNPDPDKPDHSPAKIHVPSNSASPDLYKPGGVLNVSHLTRNGGEEKQRRLEDVEFEFKQKCYLKATQLRMKDKIYGGLDDKELAPISGWPMHKPERFRKELLPSLYSLLGAMKAAWQSGTVVKGIAPTDVKGIGIISGYRGPKEEMHLWDNYFLQYLTATAKAREATGDPYGSKAVDVVVNYIAHRKAAPGHSNHSNGTAVDLWAMSKTHAIKNHYNNQSAWKASWHYAWLNANAHSFNFRNYKAEAWHWEYDT